ncbi:MAG: M42 family metallopeptidase [Candidatus Promineifilaceae bacterium]|nr:M42 family metallopeptidase [Candidatus Promineifilaceae bacterium]
MDINIDTQKMENFLVGLLNTPSPTGDTQRAMNYIKDSFEIFPFPMNLTPKGILVGTWPGERRDHPRALTAHTDTLGGMVSEIKSNGRLRISQLGGWAWTSVEGEGVTIFAGNGETFRGSFLPITASMHAHTSKERESPSNYKKMEIRIDAHTQSKKETEAIGIRVGDFVAFDPRVELNPLGFIRSRHLDDKASIATIYGALEAINRADLRPCQDTTIHISNYEEVGHGAAAGLPDNLVDLVAVDMAVVAPNQNSDEYSVTICAKDSRGPYHIGLRRELERLAELNRLSFHTDIFHYYGSDGEAYWRAGGDVRVALIGPGVDASHHYERTHRDSLEETAKLIAAYLLS